MAVDLGDSGDDKGEKPEKMFTLKKWNAVAMWSWDVECDTCAICRVQVMGKFFFKEFFWLMCIGKFWSRDLYRFGYRYILPTN